ncbi:peptidyl-tRNA hydrolase domain protein, partial [Delitschia confertaspora ATCC 74209]
RPFVTSLPLFKSNLPPRRIIEDSEIIENFLKGSGPGGQKINKTSSAVQLKHLPTGIVVKCQETRSRSQNRKIARRILGERIEELEMGEASRTAVKAREASRKKRSAQKKTRRKYRKLEEGKEDEDGEQGEGEKVREVGGDRDGEGVAGAE